MTPTENIIVHILKQEGRPLTPKEISAIGNINYGTVKQYLLKLVTKVFVTRAFYGHYTLVNPDLTVGKVNSESGGVCRVHNVVVVVDLPSDVVVKVAGGEFCFGRVCVRFRVYKCGRVVGYIGHKDGFGSPEFFMVCVEVLRRLIFEGTGWFPPVEKLVVRSAEFISDYEGTVVKKRFCISVSCSVGELLRIYQHGRALRVEVKSRPRDLGTILEFLRGRVESYTIQTRLGRVEEELKKMKEAQKYMNVILFGNVQLFKKVRELLERARPESG